MGKVRVRVLISGRVQGVSYRYYTKQQAEVLNLCGWVRNLGNGKVEAVFEGDKDKVDEMLEWCKDGSESAEVKKIEVEWLSLAEAPDDLKKFEIRETK